MWPAMTGESEYHEVARRPGDMVTLFRCIIKLGLAGRVHGVELDTSYFTGNYAPRASVQAARWEHYSVSCHMSLTICKSFLQQLLHSSGLTATL